jgi:diadenosine tetraphosphate (Ap4A) HIT family hydrolase
MEHGALADCPLCQTAGGIVLWQGPLFRVIDAADAAYPGFTRVVWTKHVIEMTDLDAEEQSTLMRAVFLVESIQRKMLQPHKINLAAFGNVVPHLHWHIIPRWSDDLHFPAPVWAAAPEHDVPAQAALEARKTSILARIPAYHAALQQALG